MATRSTIALEFPNGMVGQIYCHWNGYIMNNGRLLLGYYTTPVRVASLLELGNLSALGKTIGDEDEEFIETVNKDDDKFICEFFGRDHYNKKNLKEHRVLGFDSIEDYLEFSPVEEFNYLMTKDGTWKIHLDDTRELLDLHSEYAKAYIQDPKWHNFTNY